MLIGPRMTPELLSTVFQLRDHLQAARGAPTEPLERLPAHRAVLWGLESGAGI